MQNLIGKKFHKLTVIANSLKRDSCNRILWRCQCDCGNFTETISNRLKSGTTTSCGCSVKQNTQKGDVEVAYFILEALKRNLQISKPISDGYLYDLIVNAPNYAAKKVQIKKLQRNGQHLKITNSKKYSSKEIDILIGSDESTKTLYIIPISIIEKLPNLYGINISLLKEYLGNWDIFNGK